MTAALAAQGFGLPVVKFFPTMRDPGKCVDIDVRRPTTVRRLLRRRELRQHTSCRLIDGQHFGGAQGKRGRRRVRDFKRPTFCLYNGRPLLRRDWSRTRLQPGDQVHFVTAPGGGGQGGGKQVLGIVLAVAIAVTAPYLAGPGMLGGVLGGFWAGTTGTAMLTAGIGLGLTAAASGLMSLLITPPPMSAAPIGMSGSAASAEVSPTYNLSIQGNIARLGQPKPRLYGRHVVFPDLIMPPYELYIDQELYICTLLAVTLGQCAFHQERIGDTPIASFDEIISAKVEPGAAVPDDIVDTRMVPCRDISATSLPGAEAASPWKGPFIANPAGTLINHFEVNLVAQRGLYAFNTSTGGLLSKSVTVEVQAQEIDDTGGEIGSWTTIDTISRTDTTQRARRWTFGYDLPSAARWQIRLRRTDTQDTSTTVGHEIAWTALRGRLLSARTYAGMTLVALRMRATGDLNSQTSRQYNVIATSKLRTWDPALNGGAGGMTTELVETRSIPDVMVDMLLADYGGRGTTATVDLAGIYAAKAALDGLGWTYDAVHDTSSTVWEATGRVARAAIGERVWQGGKVRFVRDLPAVAPVMMFTPRNIRPGSFRLKFQMWSGQTADTFVAVYTDPDSWRPATLTFAFEDSPQLNSVTLQLEGVTNREQAWAMIVYFARVNLYRRLTPAFGTEMEGLFLSYGGAVSIAHDVPEWGQHAEAIAWQEAQRLLTVSEEPVWTAGESHYIALDRGDGTLAGPYPATPGPQPDQLILGAGDLPEVRVGGNRRRTRVQFGVGESYGMAAKVIGVQPRDEWTADVVTVVDDPLVYAPLPPIPDVPIGAPTGPIDVHISSNASGVNLRSIANAAGFVGLAVQPVTFYIDEGVVLTTVERGTWPAGYVPKVVGLGAFIQGPIGAPGAAGIGTAGNGANGGAGGAGGTALNTLSGAIELAGTLTIRGGPGGGGAGGAGGGASYTTQEPFGDGGTIAFPHSVLGGNGGAGNGGSGIAGPDDGSAAGGAGGNGGAAGAWGAAGANGTAGTAGDVYADVSDIFEGAGGAGGAGGAAGKSIQGIANVIFAPGHSVTLVGPTA